MSKGVLLFAFNSPKYNYYTMAVATAKRINHFLNLPVTIVTDANSITNTTYVFDNTILTTPDTSNIREKYIWINKGRYQAFEFSPYDETILLDTDYMVNSNKLLYTFETYHDFCCHNTTSFIMHPNEPQEVLSSTSFNALWATVVTFKKTKRTEQIFQCLKMVQKNYDHYANLYGFIGGLYRNDFGLTIALRIVNGHTTNKQDVIPWNLLHIGQTKHTFADTDAEFNTNYTILHDVWNRSKVKKEYISIADCDFHMMSKDNFLELVK